MTEIASEDHDRKWTEFARSVVAVLAVTVVSVLVVTVFLTAIKVGALTRQERRNDAQQSAEFLARRAYVPVVLEDAGTLKRVVDIYLEDPDVVLVQVTGDHGNVLLTQRRPGPQPRRTVTVAQDIQAPAESGLVRQRGAVGRVTMTFSLDRVYGMLGRFLAWVVAVSGLLLLLAVGASLALISRMTLRLKDLVGEARMAEDLRRSNKELEQFAFVASHDLQEPIRKIVSFSQLLERRYKGKLDAEADQFIDYIVSGGTRMRALIQDLLSFSRVGTQGRPFEPTDAEAVAREAAELFEEQLAACGGAVSIEPLPSVLADRGQLLQLFQNLIGNALKFRSDEPPRVRVSARRLEGSWRFAIEDNGLGISKEDRDKVFEMFKRLHSREKYPGTGIGLAICKKIVERHGGTIWVEPASGKGAAFSFSLPRA